MTQQAKTVLKGPPKYQQIKYFISSLNTELGSHLVNRLRNESLHPQNPHRIVGTTISNSKKQAPAGVRKIIDTSKVKFFQQILLNSDVIIYDLSTCDHKQAQFAISTLKIHPYSQQKILICVSNVMTWAKTAPKIKKQGQQQEGDENPPQQPDSEQEGAPEPAQGQQKKTYVRFTDRDYALRRPSPEYESVKSIQTLCLAAGSARANLKTYVVCSGLLYGEGEDLLEAYFTQARLQIPQSLPVLGKGKNRIPMVHISDLVTYIEKIVEKKPKIPYLLALDHNPKPTQKKIVQAISKGIGTGKIQLNSAVQKNREKQLSLNLRIKPTMIFAKIQEEEAAIEVEEGVEVVRFKFSWRCKEGIQKNIQILRKQHIKVHNLKQQKIFIIGPPGCGKTHQAKTLSKKYYLPHIHIKGVIEEIKNLKNQFGEEIKNFLNEKKESQIQAKQAEYDQLKQKWKKIPKDQRDPLPPFDPQKVDVRLSEELVYKCFKWRLTQNDCINRGYILDSYPRTYADAKEIFLTLPAAAEGQEVDENAKKIIDQRLIPSRLIVLDMTDEEILERIKSLPQEKIEGTHLVEDKIRALLQRYRKLHNTESGEFVVEDFFREAKVQCNHVRVGPQTESILQSLVRRVDNNENQEKKIIADRLEKERIEKQAQKSQRNKKEKIRRDIQHEDYIMKKENEQNEERQILDKKSLALRKYLDSNLVPILSQGIVQLLKTFPKDPVDTLAEFLFRNSLKVAHPDPSTFEF